MKTIHELLIELRACNEAIEWANNYRTIEEIVDKIERGDWLLWLAKKVGMPLKQLTLAKAMCAKTVIHLMKDQRSIDAVNIAEKFGLTDEVTLEDLNFARKNAEAAAYAYAYADDAAASAAHAAYCAADATSYSAAAETAENAEAAAYAYADGTKNKKQTADICRETIGKLLIELVNQKLINQQTWNKK
jgi:hypothetical protein